MIWLVVRVRGSVNLRGEIADTLAMLRLHKVNHATLIPDTPSYRGMLQKVKDYVTWGEIDGETLGEVLAVSGRLPGDEVLQDGHVASSTKYKTIRELGAAMVQGQATFADLPGLKPVLRLHPPRGGYEGIKRTFNIGGALGDRKTAINALVRRML